MQPSIDFSLLLDRGENSGVPYNRDISGTATSGRSEAETLLDALQRMKKIRRNLIQFQE